MVKFLSCQTKDTRENWRDPDAVSELVFQVLKELLDVTEQDLDLSEVAVVDRIVGTWCKGGSS